MCHDAMNKALAFPQHDMLDHYPELRCCQVTHMMEVKHPGERKGGHTCTAELQTMLGVTASVIPAALRFSCHLLFSASPLSRIACIGN